MIRLFKSRIYVSVFAVALFAVTAFSVDAVYFYIALAAALCHELAHIGAMKYAGADIVRISVYPCGADIKTNSSALSPLSEIKIALAGPLINLLLSLLALFFYVYGAGIYTFSFFVSNLVLFAVNIFPVKGLDGGRILFYLLLMKCDISIACRWFDIISCAAFGMLCALALFLLWVSGYNLSLVLVCTYIFISEYVKQKLCVTGLMQI